MVSFAEPAIQKNFGVRPGTVHRVFEHSPAEIMEPAFPDRMPIDVLVVEDDPIIALDFEDIDPEIGSEDGANRRQAWRRRLK